MRGAAREHGQKIGHYLIAYHGRKPWDVKLKATSELARGVKLIDSFFYGPSWASHEGGPYWRSHVWYAKPPMWRASAELTREVGAVEDMLIDALPAPAKVALLYRLANYTLRSVPSISLSVAVPKGIAKVESAKLGAITFTQNESAVEFSLPLDANDFVKLYYR